MKTSESTLKGAGKLAQDNLKRAGLGTYVRGVRISPYTDSDGEEAVRVVVTLAENTPTEERRYPRLWRVEDAIRTALRKKAITLWPYFWFRTPSELRQAPLCEA